MVNFRNLSILLGALLPTAFAAPAPVTKDSVNVIQGKYIITFRPGVDSDAVLSHLSWVSDVQKRSLARRKTAGVQKTYEISQWKGYAGEFDDATIAEIEANPDVSILSPKTEARG